MSDDARCLPRATICDLTPDVVEHVLKFCDLFSLWALSRIDCIAKVWESARLLQHQHPASDDNEPLFWRFDSFTRRMTVADWQVSDGSIQPSVDLTLNHENEPLAEIVESQASGSKMTKHLPCSWDVVRIFHNACAILLCGKRTPETEHNWRVFEHLLIEYKMTISVPEEEFSYAMFASGMGITRARIISIQLVVPRDELVAWARQFLLEAPVLFRDNHDLPLLSVFAMPPVVRKLADILRCSSTLPNMVVGYISTRPADRDPISIEVPCSFGQPDWPESAEQFLSACPDSNVWNFQNLAIFIGPVKVLVIPSDIGVFPNGLGTLFYEDVIYSFGRVYSLENILRSLAKASDSRIKKLLTGYWEEQPRSERVAEYLAFKQYK